MHVFIVGDSQSQGAGSYLEKTLKAQGHTVTRKYKVGANSPQVLELAKSYSGKTPDLVVVFGSRAEGTVPSATGIPALFPGSKILWYGPPPATRIGNLSSAKASFPAAKTVDHWFTSGYAAEREAWNKKLPQVLPGRVQYVDWRSLALPSAIKQPSGVVFPVQADGIHVGKATAEVAFSPSNWPPKSSKAPALAFAALLGGFVYWTLWRK